MKAVRAILGIGLLCCWHSGGVAQPRIDIRRGASCADAEWLRDYGSRFEWMHALAEPAGKDVAVVLLTEGGKTVDAARHVAVSGGRIEVSYPEIGYARASIARSRVATLVRSLECTGISFALDAGNEYVDNVLNQQGRRPAPAVTQGESPPPADTMTAADRAALFREVRRSSDEALGIRALRERFPEADGRGIVAAVVEVGIADISLPSLQYGLAADGTRVPKTVDVLLPDVSREPLRLMSCSGAIPRDAGATSGHTEIMLGKAVYQLAFDEQARRVQVYARGGAPHSVDIVDSDAERPATVFTTDEGRFVFKWHNTSRRMCAVQAASHPTTVTEALSGLESEGARIGTAPGARIVFVPVSPGLHARVEAVVRAALDPRVDLVSVSQGFGPLPNDQASWVARTIDRAAAYSKKPILLAAGNSGGAIQTTVAPTASRALVIGGFVPADLARVPALSFNYYREHVPESSSRGPAADGLLKPDVVVPTFHVHVQSTRGSILQGGTSHATPNASGAIAVLLGVARSHGVELSLERLLRGARLTAKPVADTPVWHAGYGRLDVNALWQYLREARQVDPLEVCIRTIAPETSTSLDCSRQPSVLLRDGVHTHDVIGFAVTWKNARKAAPRVSVRTPPSALRLERRNTTAESFAFDLRLLAPGIHIAWVDLGPDVSPAAIPITLVVPEPASASREITAKLERLDRLDIPVEIKDDTRTLTLDLRSSSRNLRVRLQEPWGYRLRRWRENLPAGPLLINPVSLRSVMTVPDPMPGTWIVSLTADAFERRGGPPPEPGVASVSLTIQQRQRDAVVATQHAKDGIALQVKPGALGDPTVRLLQGMRQERELRVGHFPAFLDVSVPSAASVLAVEAAARATDTRLSLYLYHCLADGCAPHAQLEPSRRSQRFVLNTPAEGVWRVGVLATGGCQPACDVSMNTFVGVQPSEAAAWDRESLRDDRTAFGCFLSDARTDDLEQRLPFSAVQPVGKWPLTIDFLTATGAARRCSLALRGS